MDTFYDLMKDAPNRGPSRTTIGVTHRARGGIVETDLIAVRPS